MLARAIARAHASARRGIRAALRIPPSALATTVARRRPSSPPRGPSRAGAPAARHRLCPNDHPSPPVPRDTRTPARPRQGPSPVTHHQPCAQPHPTAGAAPVPRAPPQEPSRTPPVFVPPPGSRDAHPRSARNGLTMVDARWCQCGAGWTLRSWTLPQPEGAMLREDRRGTAGHPERAASPRRWSPARRRAAPGPEKVPASPRAAARRAELHRDKCHREPRSVAATGRL